MYYKFVLSLTITKEINGMLVSDTDSVEILLVPFMIEAIDFNIDGVKKSNHQVIVDYYQIYTFSISSTANYNENYNRWLDRNGYKTVAQQLLVVEENINNNISNFSIISQGTSTNRTSLLKPGVNEYSGEVYLRFNTDNRETSIRFLLTEISEFLWADVGIKYTSSGVQICPVEIAEYSFSDYILPNIYTNSDEDRPEPIASVDDFLKMKEGVNYILMKDLYLVNWTPINARFTSLDGLDMLSQLYRLLHLMKKVINFLLVKMV